MEEAAEEDGGKGLLMAWRGERGAAMAPLETEDDAGGVEDEKWRHRKCHTADDAEEG